MSSGRCDLSVTELSEVRKGDHIRWDRGSYSDHAIVTDKNIESKKNLRVVYYTNPKRKATKNSHSTACAEIVEEWVKAFTDDKLYVVDYRKPTYPCNEVIRQARSRLGEKKVKPLNNNCESFAIWCKTAKKNIPLVGPAVRLAQVVPVVGPVVGKAVDTADKVVGGVVDTTDRVIDAADRVVDRAVDTVVDTADRVVDTAEK